VNTSTKNTFCFSDYLNDAAQDHFGLTYIFPYQRLIISNILEGAGYFGDDLGENGAVGDVPRRQIAILPTGAGKSLCFMLPGVLLDGITVILFPLLSLMSDQKRRLEERGIDADIIAGGQSREERAAAWLRLESGQSRFLLSNPETMVQPNALRHLTALQIAHLVIDEAHTVPMWGQQFRPALTQIPEIIEAASPRMTSAFTATASDTVLKGIQSILFPDEPAHVIRANPDRPNISYHVIPILSKSRELRRLLALHIPARQDQGDGLTCGSVDRGSPERPNPLRVPRPALIFCPTRAVAEQTAARLRRDLGEDEIFFYHAGLEREEKKTVEDWFFRSKTGILCATTAYGMGVDKAGIRTVIHHSPSQSVEAFLQESGRAGRDGAPSFSIVLLPPGSGAVKQRQKPAGEPGAIDGRERAAADQRRQSLIQALEDDTHCLRENLLRSMGSECEMCWGCDICHKSRPRHPEGREELFSFFRRHNWRYTPRRAAIILRGGPGTYGKNSWLEHVAGSGALSEWYLSEIREAIAALIASGALKKPRRGFRRDLVGIDTSTRNKISLVRLVGIKIRKTEKISRRNLHYIRRR